MRSDTIAGDVPTTALRSFCERVGNECVQFAPLAHLFPTNPHRYGHMVPHRFHLKLWRFVERYSIVNRRRLMMVVKRLVMAVVVVMLVVRGRIVVVRQMVLMVGGQRSMGRPCTPNDAGWSKFRELTVVLGVIVVFVTVVLVRFFLFLLLLRFRAIVLAECDLFRFRLLRVLVTVDASMLAVATDGCPRWPTGVHP